MKVNCQEHSKTMQLFALKAELEKGIPDPEKRKEVQDRVKILEKELEID